MLVPWEDEDEEQEEQHEEVQFKEVGYRSGDNLSGWRDARDFLLCDEESGTCICSGMLCPEECPSCDWVTSLRCAYDAASPEACIRIPRRLVRTEELTEIVEETINAGVDSDTDSDADDDGNTDVVPDD